MKINTKRKIVIYWKRLPNTPYEVSSIGQIRRADKGQGTSAGRLVKPQKHSAGYSMYGLRMNNKRFFQTAHKAVALAFKGPQPTPQHQAAHSDGNPENNCVYNIFWRTPKENEHEKKKHGTYFKRGKRTAAKLTDDQAKEIRRLYKTGSISYKELGKKFFVHPTTCWHVVTRVTYSHIL